MQQKFNQFTKTLYNFYDQNKRDLPWRNTNDPYKILVSEIMLQQTQVHRVIPKYNAFVKQFPNLQKLARAKTPTVLNYWSGLGYNHRALNLHKTAQLIHKKYGGKVPQSIPKLIELPGIGLPTAAAICTYAFNKPYPFIETNVRTVFIHHFFKNQTDIHDNQLLPLVQQALDNKNPRKWYSALMDYGTHLKKQHGNNITKSKHHTKQSKFHGSNRQKRGAILKYLLTNKTATLAQFAKDLNYQTKELTPVITQLIAEGFITHKNKTYSLKK